MNPKWVKNFTIDWYEDGVQWLLFEVWDEDDDVDHELIGKTELQLSTIMQAPRLEFCCALTHKKLLRGTIKIKADCVIVSNDTIKLHLNGELKSRKFLCCGTDNPYLYVERARLLN